MKVRIKKLNIGYGEQPEWGLSSVMESRPLQVRQFEVRQFKIVDTPAILQLFYDTVHRVNCRDYSPEQLNVWAPQQMDEAQWRSRLSRCLTLVAEQNTQIVGFCELEADGHIGCFYCHYQHQHQGIGSMLLEQVEAIAQQRNLTKLFTEASITAKPFFEHRGFQTIKAQQVERSGIFLRNYVMEKVMEKELLEKRNERSVP